MNADGVIQVFTGSRGSAGTINNIIAAPGVGWKWVIVGWTSTAGVSGFKFQNDAGGSDITVRWTNGTIAAGVPIINSSQGYGASDENTAVDCITYGAAVVWVFAKKVKV